MGSNSLLGASKSNTASLANISNTPRSTSRKGSRPINEEFQGEFLKFTVPRLKTGTVQKRPSRPSPVDAPEPDVRQVREAPLTPQEAANVLRTYHVVPDAEVEEVGNAPNQNVSDARRVRFLGVLCSDCAPSSGYCYSEDHPALCFANRL
jgi:hypothetical protein